MMLWPILTAVLLALTLMPLRLVFPLLAVDVGIVTGVVLSLAGAQVCASVVSPIAVGAGAIVMGWAFGLAHAFAVGRFGPSGLGSPFSGVIVRSDLFIAVAGAPIGLSAPRWPNQFPALLVGFMLAAVAISITTAGWLMAQPMNAAGASAPRILVTQGSLGELRRWRWFRDSPRFVGVVCGVLSGGLIGLVTKVELFEQIRKDYEFCVGTIAGVAKKLNVHRRMVREAIGSALPAPRKKVERPRWKLAAAAAFVNGILKTDKKAPRKQRHTAHRFWERIQREMPECQACERTVRNYVHERKIELGLVVHETFVPQSYNRGVEAQVDWYDAYADLSGERTKLQGFSMRSMASGAAFHGAFLHATQQAFLEAHEHAFAYFGGVFRRLR